MVQYHLSDGCRSHVEVNRGWPGTGWSSNTYMMGADPMFKLTEDGPEQDGPVALI